MMTFIVLHAVIIIFDSYLLFYNWKSWLAICKHRCNDDLRQDWINSQMNIVPNSRTPSPSIKAFAYIMIIYSIVNEPKHDCQTILYVFVWVIQSESRVVYIIKYDVIHFRQILITPEWCAIISYVVTLPSYQFLLRYLPCLVGGQW